MNQFARNDQAMATETETRFAGIRRQPAARRVSKLKIPKSSAVVTPPTTQKRRNCLADSISNCSDRSTRPAENDNSAPSGSTQQVVALCLDHDFQPPPRER